MTRKLTLRILCFMLAGAIGGALLGMLEAIITAAGAADYERRVAIHFGQAGGCFIAFGVFAGYFIAAWIDDRRENRITERRRHGLCIGCGYDLRGLDGGRCPECGRSRTIGAETNRGE